MMAPFFDDVTEPEDEGPPNGGGAPTVSRAQATPTAWSWLPPRLLECARCSAVTLTQESRCGRCGWREGT